MVPFSGTADEVGEEEDFDGERGVEAEVETTGVSDERVGDRDAEPGQVEQREGEPWPERELADLLHRRRPHPHPHRVQLQYRFTHPQHAQYADSPLRMV